MKKVKPSLAIFEYLHDNPPPPFNPLAIPYARDVATIATANCHKIGVYKNPSLHERAAIRMKEYERLMKLGKPLKSEVISAKDYLYNL